jgi:hypothetical protein
MTTTPGTTVDDRPHLFLAGLAEQAQYAFGFAKAGQHKEALEHADAIERLIAAYRAAIGARSNDLTDLVKDLTDPDPCHFDHHGYCQAHGWFATEPACPHGRAHKLFPETKES